MTLHAVSPIDGRYAKITHPLSAYFSEAALVKARFLIELRYFQALLMEIPEGLPIRQNLKQLDDLYLLFSDKDVLRIKQVEFDINHDVKAVEYFLREKLHAIPLFQPFIEFVHFGITSEDINNLAYALLIKEAMQKITVMATQDVLSSMKTFATNFSKTPMLSRTHGQSATPTTMGKEFNIFHYRLETQLKQLKAYEYKGKLNGATGNFNAHAVAYPETNWPNFSQKFVQKLGLFNNPLTTQIEPHDMLAEVSHTMVRINTILIDFSRDIWGYISLNYFTQASQADEVGSSTMPHKINPIDFENAEGNLGLSNALFSHFAEKLPISRFQRDLSDSTVMRSIGSAIAYSLIAYRSLLKGMSKISVNTDQLNQELENHWEILAEPIQTVLRKYGREAPYESLKALTRGKKVTKKIIHDFIGKLDLPKEEIEKLKALTPQSYIGYAGVLAEIN
jgi:adenylosuccinate lyase